ncbi:GNAT family N-acetyltransferase [Chloroflexota bacterium]|nr:GNAT family N-acetyltransferase [Chloroflexota bacterium]
MGHIAQIMAVFSKRTKQAGCGLECCHAHAQYQGRLGLRNYMRSMECENFVGATHIALMKNRPHYYLWGLAVEPAKKSLGIGSALMQPLLAQADAQKMPIYLETHDEKNVRYYQKHGFDLLHTACIPKYQLSFWCMMRGSV